MKDLLVVHASLLNMLNRCFVVKLSGMHVSFQG